MSHFTPTLLATVLNVTNPHQIPITLSLSTILTFVIWTILVTPLNLLWQQFLERTFPGTVPASTPKTLPNSPAKEHVVVPGSRLHKGNLLKKFVIDQTVGAGLNTVGFIAFLAGVRGGSMRERIIQDFWPYTSAGLRFWPFVSLLCFAVVPVNHRVVVGSAFGVVWGVYMSLVVGV